MVAVAAGRVAAVPSASDEGSVAVNAGEGVLSSKEERRLVVVSSRWLAAESVMNTGRYAKLVAHENSTTSGKVDMYGQMMHRSGR